MERRRREILRQVDLYAQARARAEGNRRTTRGARAAVVRAALRPAGRLAERVLSPLPWLARYGERFPRALLAAIGKAGPGHHVLHTAEVLPPEGQES